MKTSTLINQARRVAGKLNLTEFAERLRLGIETAIIYSSDDVAYNYLKSVGADSMPHEQRRQHIAQAQKTSEYIARWKRAANERAMRRIGAN